MGNNFNPPNSLVQPEQIEPAVLLIRGRRVPLDRDRVALAGVTTSNLNKSVKCNLDRFPADFMFQLTLAAAQAIAGRRWRRSGGSWTAARTTHGSGSESSGSIFFFEK